MIIKYSEHAIKIVKRPNEIIVVADPHTEPDTYSNAELRSDSEGHFIMQGGKLVREFYNVPLDISYEQ